MESTDSSTVSLSQQPQLPPGFRFHPTDEELVVFYLKKKAAKAPLPVSIIAAVDIYKFDPWELPAKATFGEQEWYFFSPRERKYPNGERPNRAATSGYWKATGIDKPVLTSGGTQKVGVKKALVFYGGKPPKGIKTNWIMHEYRLINNQKSNSKQPGYDSPTKKPSLRLDDCVLCRIYKKKNISSRPMDDYVKDNMIDMIPSNSMVGFKASNYGAFLENEQNMFINGIINNNNNEGISSGSGSGSGSISMSSDQQVSLIGDASTSVELPAKQLFLKGEINTCPYTKRYLEEETNTMFNQLPQNTSFHQQMLLADADGLFRPPPFQVQGLNWFN